MHFFFCKRFVMLGDGGTTKITSVQKIGWYHPLGQLFVCFLNCELIVIGY